MTPPEKLAKSIKRKRSPRNRSDKVGRFQCSVREVREKLRITLNAAAKATGISPAGLSVIERGADVQLSTMRKLAKFYGKGLNELWPS